MDGEGHGRRDRALGVGFPGEPELFSPGRGRWKGDSAYQRTADASSCSLLIHEGDRRKSHSAAGHSVPSRQQGEEGAQGDHGKSPGEGPLGPGAWVAALQLPGKFRKPLRRGGHGANPPAVRWGEEET